VFAVVFYCHSGTNVEERFLYRAQDRNMTNGDFAFFTFQPFTAVLPLASRVKRTRPVQQSYRRLKCLESRRRIGEFAFFTFQPFRTHRTDRPWEPDPFYGDYYDDGVDDRQTDTRPMLYDDGVDEEEEDLSRRQRAYHAMKQVPVVHSPFANGRRCCTQRCRSFEMCTCKR